MNTTFVDFEFLDLGNGKKFAHSMGISGSKTRRPQELNFSHSFDDIYDAFDDLASDVDAVSMYTRGGRIKSARAQLAVASGGGTPGAAMWGKALDEFESIMKNKGPSGDVTGVAENLSKELGGLSNLYTSKIDLGKDKIIGSNFLSADLPYLDKFANYQRQNVSDLVNVSNPSGGYAKFASMFTSGDKGLLNDAFKGEVAQSLTNTHGYSREQVGSLKWGARHGMSQATYGLEDLFHFTGGKAAHATHIIDEMARAGVTIDPNEIGGAAGIGGRAHGALYDAVVSQSVYRRLQQMGTPEDIVIGKQNLINARVAQARVQLGEVESEVSNLRLNPDLLRQLHAAEMIDDITPGPGTVSKISEKSANNLKPQQGFGKIIGNFRRSGMYESVQKSQIAKNMKGKWGSIAALGAAAAVAGGMHNEYSARKTRQSMPVNYLSTDKLSTALAMGLMEQDYQLNTFTGADMGQSSLGLGKFMMSAAVLSDPVTRMMGFEMGLPGSRKARLYGAGKTGFKAGLAKTYGFIGNLGLFPNPISAQEMSAPGRLASYRKGSGPIFNKPTMLKFLDRPTDAINKWYLGGLADVSDVSVRSAYNVASKGLSPGASDKQKISHYKNVSRSLSNLIQRHSSLISIADEDLMKGFSSTGSDSRKIAFNRTAKSVADVELRSLQWKRYGKVAAAAGFAVTALWVADLMGGLVKATHNYGSASMAAKKEAPRMLNMPAGGSLRMLAMQNAALSFGAMRSAIGNEAMSNHRY